METRIEKGFTGKYLYISNGKDEYKYNITGFASMAEVYKSVPIDRQFLLKLIDELLNTGRKIEEDNKSINSLIVDAQNIYIRKTDGYIMFVYFPGSGDKTLDGYLLSLAEFVIQRVDYDDEIAVDLAYYFYRMIYSGDYLFDTSSWK